MVSMVSLVIRAGEYSPEDSDAFSGRGLGKPETTPLVELRSFGPGDVPDVALRVPPAEAATPELLLRLLEQLDPVDPGERLVGRPHLRHRREVDTQREAAEALGDRPEDVLVVGRSVERDGRAVRRLEDRVVLVARRRLGPAERPEDRRHPLNVPAGEGDEADARRDRHAVH